MKKIYRSIMPSLYRIVKKRKWLLKIAIPLWHLTSNLINWLEGVSFKKSFPGPTKIWVSSLDWFNQKGHTIAGCEMVLLHGEEAEQRAMPSTLQPEVDVIFLDNLNKVKRPGFLLKIPQGRSIQEGYILTPNNELLGDVSVILKTYGDLPSVDHPLLKVKKISAPKIIPGKVAVLSKFAGRGFYHWILEVLPRLELIRQAGIPIESIDKFVVNTMVGGFHKRTLEQLGIPLEKVIESHWTPHIQADELIVPSLTGEGDNYPIWVKDFLIKHFQVLPPRSDQPKLLYVNRHRNTHRRLTNELEVEKMLAEYGFVSITPETLTLVEKAQLFAGADSIVGPHGSGLINIIFCKPGTKMIELFHPAGLNLGFWNLANQAQADYYYQKGTEVRGGDNLHLPSEIRDFSIDCDQLRRTLELSGIKRMEIAG